MPSAEKLKIIQSVPKENLPRHIGIIMDGNSRWAKQKSLPQSKGHREGGKAVEKISKAKHCFLNLRGHANTFSQNGEKKKECIKVWE